MVLRIVQQKLEQCCFEFVAKWFPQALKEKGLECAEALEITGWAQMIPDLCQTLNAEIVYTPVGMTLEDAFLFTRQLRDSAVHRHRTETTVIQDMAHSATTLAFVLGDVPQAAHLKTLEEHVQSNIDLIQQHKTLLKARLDQELQEVARESSHQQW